MDIDIMMPFYGDVAQFKTAVNSVIAQQDPNWRLVVIDDQYPDAEPRRFVEALADRRITYVVNSANIGISANFQRSIELAEAEYVVIMGCDDVMLPNYVGRMRELTHQHPSSSYIQPGVAVIDDAGNRLFPLGDRVKAHYRPAAGQLSGDKLAASLLRANWTYFPSLCWKRSALRQHGFRQDYRIVLDLALQLSILESGGSLLVDDEVTFEYRRHAGSASSWKSSGSSRFREEAELFAETARRMRSLGWGRAQAAARLHLTSRLNALTQLPGAVGARDGAGIAALLRHVLVS